jgi:hypothetical protein
MSGMFGQTEIGQLRHALDLAVAAKRAAEHPITVQLLNPLAIQHI